MFCNSSNPPPTPCDNENPLTDGGHVTLHITKVATASQMSVATAVVLSSNDPAHAVVGKSLTFTLRGDVISSPLGTFCDPKADAARVCG
ncbi:MAG: hypothetical protein M3O28_00835 [Actinomycetota bacterium]|nr:hypothetical protein [Actinomycetota bacterium]